MLIVRFKICLLVLALSGISTSALLANATFNPADTTIIDLTLCEDECVIINGNQYCDGGVFEDLLIGTDGCDSLLIITIDKIIPLHLDYFLCEGECLEIPIIDSLFCPLLYGYYSFDIGPCADAIFLHVDDPPLLPVINAFVCAGECIVLGLYLDSLTICPTSDTILLIPYDNTCPIPDTAIIIVQVTGTPTLDSLIYYQCPGECVEFDNGTFCNDFSATFDFISSGGCDSIIYFEVNIYPVDDDTVRLGICENNCVPWGNMEFCEPMIFTDSLSSLDGCDSAVVIIIEELALLPQLLPDDVLLEISESFTFEIPYDNFSVTWNSGVDSNIFVFQAADFGTGTHPVSAIMVDPSTGCIRASDTTFVTVFEQLSAVEDEPEINIRIFPNPISTNQLLFIELPAWLFANTIDLKLKSLDGIEISAFSPFKNIGKNALQMSLPNGLAAGIYLLELQTDRGSLVKKLMVY